MDKKLVDAVLAAAREDDGKKKLSCADAFKLAVEFEVQPIEIGKICNKQSVKICKCQLGCFK